MIYLIGWKFYISMTLQSFQSYIHEAPIMDHFSLLPTLLVVETQILPFKNVEKLPNSGEKIDGLHQKSIVPNFYVFAF